MVLGRTTWLNITMVGTEVIGRKYISCNDFTLGIAIKMKLLTHHPLRARYSTPDS